MPRYFHVTPADNLPAILEQGLVPLIGERSAACGEAKEAVYLFTSIEAVEDAFGSWMDDCFDDEAELVLLGVEVGTHAQTSATAEYEAVVLTPIEPAALSVLSHDLLGECDLSLLAAELEAAGAARAPSLTL